MFKRTPRQVIDKGEVFYYQASDSPTETAWCMGRAAEERATIWRPTVRPLGTDGTVELLVQVLSGGGSTTIAVAHLRPVTIGSEVTLWLNRQPLHGGRDDFLDDLGKWLFNKGSKIKIVLFGPDQEVSPCFLSKTCVPNQYS